MFTVKAIGKAVCIACGKETECFEVESQQRLLSGWLCVPDFRRQVKIAMAASDAQRPQPPQSALK